MVDTLTGLLTRDRTALYPWFVLVGLVVAWLVSIALGSGWSDVTGKPVGANFLAFYDGSHASRREPAVDLYDVGQTVARQQALLAGMPTGYHIPYLNPPVALLWYAPLRVFPYGGALFAWWTVGALAWIGAHRALLATSEAPIAVPAIPTALPCTTKMAIT